MDLHPDSAPLLIDDHTAAAMAGISRAHLHRLRAAGKWGQAGQRVGIAPGNRPS